MFVKCAKSEKEWSDKSFCSISNRWLISVSCLDACNNNSQLFVSCRPFVWSTISLIFIFSVFTQKKHILIFSVCTTHGMNDHYARTEKWTHFHILTTTLMLPSSYTHNNKVTGWLKRIFKTIYNLSLPNNPRGHYFSAIIHWQQSVYY